MQFPDPSSLINTLTEGVSALKDCVVENGLACAYEHPYIAGTVAVGTAAVVAGSAYLTFRGRSGAVAQPPAAAPIGACPKTGKAVCHCPSGSNGAEAEGADERKLKAS